MRNQFQRFRGHIGRKLSFSAKTKYLGPLIIPERTYQQQWCKISYTNGIHTKRPDFIPIFSSMNWSIQSLQGKIPSGEPHIFY